MRDKQHSPPPWVRSQTQVGWVFTSNGQDVVWTEDMTDEDALLIEKAPELAHFVRKLALTHAYGATDLNELALEAMNLINEIDGKVTT